MNGIFIIAAQIVFYPGAGAKGFSNPFYKINYLAAGAVVIANHRVNCPGIRANHHHTAQCVFIEWQNMVIVF
ncbi:hypothetical protein GALL_459330 [mine drainage metagenome]|uniref:Uncharacterized protein n=1 Tax=mine drainage metagenome TaxID=410659 RepID=A0A1J5Q4N9_9ZZZZ